MLTRSRKIPYILILCLFLLLYIMPLGLRPLLRPDEVRYGQVPREMIQSGDWIVPNLNGLRYFEKTVLGYWLHAFSIQVFGENAFAIRFPSAIAAGLSALLIFLLARRFIGGYTTGVLTLLIFLTSLEVVVIGTLRNTLGPHHAKPELGFAGPESVVDVCDARIALEQFCKILASALEDFNVAVEESLQERVRRVAFVADGINSVHGFVV